MPSEQHSAAFRPVELAAIDRVFGRDASARRLLAWQTGYLPVYGAWALVAAAAIPPLFSFR